VSSTVENILALLVHHQQDISWHWSTKNDTSGLLQRLLFLTMTGFAQIYNMSRWTSNSDAGAFYAVRRRDEAKGVRAIKVAVTLIECASAGTPKQIHLLGLFPGRHTTA
jgi:hypothetical protein